MDFRADSWVSTLSGLARALGQKIAGVTYEANAASSPQLYADLYEDNYLAAKICNAVPEDATRQGWYYSGLEPEADKAIRGKWRDLDLIETMVRAWVWGRLFGGGLLLLGLDDGRNDSPLYPNTRSRLIYVKDIDCRHISVANVYRNPRSPKYGLPEIYRINDPLNPLGQSELFHETRVIRFGGVRTTSDKKVGNNGWDNSILRKCNDVIKTHGVTWTAVSNAVVDATLVVYKRKNLARMVAQGKEEEIRLRLQLLEAGRDMSRALLIDMDDEDIVRQVMDLKGYPEIIKMSVVEVCAAAEMPEMLLFGQPPSGLAASGNNEIRGYYDRVTHAQTNILVPRIEKIDPIIMSELGIKPSEENELTFNPLWTKTDAEDAEYDEKRSRTIRTYIDGGVFAPEELTDQVADELSLKIEKMPRLELETPPTQEAVNE